jgi:hypothetical protein
MNAYKIANHLALERIIGGDCNSTLNLKAIDMLRQQADQIAELEHCLIVEQEHNEMLEKDNDEPVAWLMVDREDGNRHIQMGIPTRDEKVSHQLYPLYTRPSKQLSDEKIEEIFLSETGFPMDTDAKVNEVAMLDFVRAIIKEMNDE